MAAAFGMLIHERRARDVLYRCWCGAEQWGAGWCHVSRGHGKVKPA